MPAEEAEAMGAQRSGGVVPEIPETADAVVLGHSGALTICFAAALAFRNEILPGNWVDTAPAFAGGGTAWPPETPGSVMSIVSSGYRAANAWGNRGLDTCLLGRTSSNRGPSICCAENPRLGIPILGP
eukprot:3795796-Rhodomonas_salina.1